MSLRVVVKTAIMLPLVLCYFFSCASMFIFMRDQYRRKAIISRILSFWTGVACKVLNIKVKVVKGEHYLKDGTNYMVIGNHVSYTDILVLSSTYPTNYITSFEMRERLEARFFTDVAGCVYVERRHKENRAREIEEITKSIEGGARIVLYPEATSTNGEAIRMFRKGMFVVPLELKHPLLICVLQYTKINGEKVTTANRDLICWYDEMGMLEHISNFMKQKSVEVEVSFVEVVDPSKFSTPEDLANHCQSIVVAHYKPIAAS